MSKFNIIKIDNPNYNNINSIEYLGIECLFYNESSKYKNYVKVSKWAIGRRDFSEWYRLKSTKRLIQDFVIKLGRNDLILSIVNLSKEYRGMYMHIDLAIHFAQWTSTDFSFKVSQFLKSDILIKYEQKISTLTETTAKLANDNKEIKTELNNKNTKIKKLTDFVSDLAINTVPTEEWNIFSVFKIDNSSYKVIRSKREDYETKISKYNQYINIFKINVPNAIEFFKTFKSIYKKQYKTQIKFKNIDITLNQNINENDIIELFKIHESRIQQKISKVI